MVMWTTRHAFGWQRYLHDSHDDGSYTDDFAPACAARGDFIDVTDWKPLGEYE